MENSPPALASSFFIPRCSLPFPILPLYSLFSLLSPFSSDQATEPSPLAMSRLGSFASQSVGSGASRMHQQGLAEGSSTLHLGEYPLGEETGLPLIPCPDCGLARVIERRSAKEATKNYLRVYFKCPRNGFPKLCGFYEFQRQYLAKLCELGIVRISSCPAMDLEIADGGTAQGERGDATSVNTARDGAVNVEARKQRKKEAKLQAKIDQLVWKFNLLILVFAVLVGCVFMYLAMKVK